MSLTAPRYHRIFHLQLPISAIIRWDCRKFGVSWWYDFDRQGVAVGWCLLLNLALRDLPSARPGQVEVGRQEKKKTGFSPWRVGNAIGDTACAPKFILPRLSRLRLFHQIGKRGVLAIAFLSPNTQERRDMDLFVLTGIVELIHIVELHCPL